MIEPPFIQPGASLTRAHRMFVAVACEPYVRRDGTRSQVVTWRGRCAACEASFEVRGSRSAAHLPINCLEHRGKRTRRPAKRQHAPIHNAAALRDAIDTALEAIRARNLKSAALQLVGALRMLGGSHER